MTIGRRAACVHQRRHSIALKTPGNRANGRVIAHVARDVTRGLWRGIPA